MKFLPAAALGFMLVSLAGFPRLSADEVYKWTDSEGRIHYSNRSGGSPPDSGANNSSPPGGEGWESVLERQKDSEEFQQRAETALNSFELQRTRKMRDRSLAQEELDATQAAITRAVQNDPTKLPALKTQEAAQTAAVRKIDQELSAIDQEMAKLRAMKAAGKSAASH